MNKLSLAEFTKSFNNEYNLQLTEQQCEGLHDDYIVGALDWDDIHLISKIKD